MSAGVKNADENELKAIASPPAETHVYNVADFSVMSEIVEGLTKTVCDRVEQLDKQIKGLKSDDGLISQIHCTQLYFDYTVDAVGYIYKCRRSLSNKHPVTT